MGIPKLMQDLTPYREPVTLGKRADGDAVSVRSVVIDGPSFVYHVYRRQMESLPQVLSPISYRDINEGVVGLLDQIQNHGVDIKGIFFDGALPASKREIRLARLERHRHQLERFVKPRVMKDTHRDPPPQPAKSEMLLTQIPDSSSHNMKALEPPFMVASAVEYLRGSRFASSIRIIPDEAEVGCLLSACTEQVAVLSNDSDVVVYPPASANSLILVLLHTLEQDGLDDGGRTLMAKCLRPSEITRRLQISSLHVFAFQRRMDHGASFAVISQRSRNLPTLQSTLNEFDNFVREYPFDILSRLEVYLSIHDRNLLDPRLSELRFQYSHSRHSIKQATRLHMYLPALFEDPTCEAPWSHGSELRQLAYSLLNLSMPAALQRSTLQEYQRRGNRVGVLEMDLLSSEELLAVLDEDIELLQGARPGASAEEIMSMWQQLALHAVNKRRREELRTSSLPSYHLGACVQAVLYSLRLFKQVLDLVHREAPYWKLMAGILLGKLASLPSLADMMDATRARR